MKTVQSLKQCREIVATWRKEGASIGFVPTMGALHDAHLSLVRQSLRDGHKTIVSVFVNPKQFGPNEDYTTYPRVLDADAELLRGAGVHLLFAPTVEEMYPAGFATHVHVGGLTQFLCGATRSGHFEGVATVVTKLLNQVQADAAYFGEKDWQQLQVIKRLTADLDIATRIIGVPIMREDDGLALSSRNRYLNANDRAKAPLLNITLRSLAEDILAGGDIAALLKTAAHGLNENGFAVDYLEFADARLLSPLRNLDKSGRLFVAARIGGARLIDNWPVN
ncbi:MAG: pantoate--beta-alanine ligase [Alphaproteobacteria bacterium]|nr:pantoate--beta-alanine ligase [Alphaproteobacteria bacterium]